MWINYRNNGRDNVKANFLSNRCSSKYWKQFNWWRPQLFFIICAIDSFKWIFVGFLNLGNWDILYTAGMSSVCLYSCFIGFSITLSLIFVSSNIRYLTACETLPRHTYAMVWMRKLSKWILTWQDFYASLNED